MRKKRSLRLLIIIGIVFTGICLLLFKSFFRADHVMANIALQEGDKVYLFSMLGTDEVKQNVSQQNSPTIMPFIQVFEENGLLYVRPTDVKEIVNILCGNYRIHAYPEKSFDGYITTTQLKCFALQMRNESTEKIGEQLKVNEISLTSPVSDASLLIKWSINQITGQTEALENCSKKSFRVVERPHPGETYASSKEFIVVDLKDIGGFYDEGIGFRLDMESQLLYLGKDVIAP